MRERVSLLHGKFSAEERSAALTAAEGCATHMQGSCIWAGYSGSLVVYQQPDKECPMTEPSLRELEAERDRLHAQLSAIGDFRRGSVSENYRKCGKPNCACAQPDHPGHGPRFLWTRTARGRGTVGRQLAAGEVAKVRREVARHAEFASVSERIAEVNEKICEARPIAGTDAPSMPEGGKGGSARRSRRRRPPR